MLTLNSEFERFDREIRPSDDVLTAARLAHIDLRKRLNADSKIQEIHVADFLQGSYARHTMNAPSDKADVDIVLVTNLDERDPRNTPQAVLNWFSAWLGDQYGAQRVSLQGRSVGLELNEVCVDLVPTSAPSEVVRQELRSYAERSIFKALGPEDDLLNPDEIFGPDIEAILDKEWSKQPLRIPDRHAQAWQDTHPLATLVWTRQKNKRCDQLFLRVVRALKWWRKRVSEGPNHPKSYPIEHMVGDACPEDSTSFSVAEGVVRTLEQMRDTLYPHYRVRKAPHLALRGLEHSSANVLALLTSEDFCAYYEALVQAARDARFAASCDDAHQAGLAWQKVLGEAFPVPPKPKPPTPSGGYTPRTSAPTHPSEGRFA